MFPFHARGAFPVMGRNKTRRHVHTAIRMKGGAAIERQPMIRIDVFQQQAFDLGKALEAGIAGHRCLPGGMCRQGAEAAEQRQTRQAHHAKQEASGRLSKLLKISIHN